MNGSAVGRCARVVFSVFLFSMLCAAVSSPAAADVAPGGPAADVVLGQMNFDANGKNIVKPEGMNYPGQIAFDTTTAPGLCVRFEQ